MFQWCVLGVIEIISDPRIKRVMLFFSLFVAFMIAVSLIQYNMIVMIREIRSVGLIFIAILTNNMLAATAMLLGSMLVFRVLLPSFHEICSEGVIRMNKLDCMLVEWGLSRKTLLASLLALSFIVGSSITSAIRISAIYNIKLRPENIYSYLAHLALDPLSLLYIAMEISAYFIAVHAARSRVEMFTASISLIAVAAYIETMKIANPIP